jgi:hypothetical protein
MPLSFSRPDFFTVGISSDMGLEALREHGGM